MRLSTSTGWLLLIATGLCLSGPSLLAADKSAADKNGVIIDPTWTILIRPAKRAPQAPSLETESASGVTPAVNEGEAPAPESAPKPELPAVPVKPIGPELPPQLAPQAQTMLPAGPPRMTYAEAYAAVPFSRAEYEGNPVYRHQAALELMFGVQRPTTLVQNYTPRAFRYPDSYQIPYGRSDTQHINIRRIGRPYGAEGVGYPFGGVPSSW